MLNLIDDLTNTASSIPAHFNGNAHNLEALIMSRWLDIRRAAIQEGVFRVSDTQENLFQKIYDNVSTNKHHEIVTILNRVKAMFVVNNKVDAFEDEQIGSKPECYIAINALEFWLVIHRYIPHAKKSDDSLPSFEELIIESVEHTPSHGGYVVNPFYIIAEKRFTKSSCSVDSSSETIQGLQPNDATSNPTDLTAPLQLNCMIGLASAGLILLCLALACSASTAAIAFGVIGSVSLLASAGLFAYKKFFVRDEKHGTNVLVPGF